MAWHPLTDTAQVDALVQASHQQPQLILKHSTRCNISHMAERRLTDALPKLEAHLVPHHLDLVRHREVSNYIAEHLQVPHQSPQVLLLKHGDVILEQDHYGVNAAEVLEVLGA